MTADDLLAGIRDGDSHFGGIRCLRLFRLDRALALGMRNEVDRLCANERCSDVQEREHVTNWTQPTGAVRQYSLLNRSGDFADFRDDHDLSCVGKRFADGERYPLLGAFIACLPHAINFRISVLAAGAGLSPHEEHSLFVSQAGTPAVRARFHLPIRTSRDARVVLDGEEFRFLPRTVYYFNQGCVHSARNLGPAPRVHFVWDQLLTAQVFKTMFCADIAPSGWRPIEAANREPRIVGRESKQVYMRQAPRVTPAEAARVALSSVQ
jgi:hypothetical protein